MTGPRRRPSRRRTLLTAAAVLLLLAVVVVVGAIRGASGPAPVRTPSPSATVSAGASGTSGR